MTLPRLVWFCLHARLLSLRHDAPVNVRFYTSEGNYIEFASYLRGRKMP